MSYQSQLIISPTKSAIPSHLHPLIISLSQKSIAERDIFTIAMSGGSLPSFLQNLPASFSSANVDPQFSKWHVLLADERVVASSSPDNNMSAVREAFLKEVPIPAEQIYDIATPFTANEGSETIATAVAEWYEKEVVVPLLSQAGGQLDCALLGFGPDGHTCSLFPGHDLLDEMTKLVAPIEDSPKPPPRRITLTFKVLNELTRSAIFCGAGGSKNPILKAVFQEGSFQKTKGDRMVYNVVMTDPAPYPCGMVRPSGGEVVWVVDADAAVGLA